MRDLQQNAQIKSPNQLYTNLEWAWSVGFNSAKVQEGG